MAGAQAVSSHIVVPCPFDDNARSGKPGAQSMMVKKVRAASEAIATLMFGGSPETIIARYRQHVAAHTKPLSAA